MRRNLFTAFLLALLPLHAAAADPVQRQVAGNRTTENVPEVPADLLERLDRYQNTRGASLAGWTREGCLLVSTRFAETAQATRVGQRRIRTTAAGNRRRRQLDLAVPHPLEFFGIAGAPLLASLSCAAAGSAISAAMKANANVRMVNLPHPAISDMFCMTLL